ncbi:MAG: hypothetical protein IPK99_14525, partial [Flavobacteriales bacterium]|nr:hypothetical protein [Flavobacteriales bacterium]
MQRGFDHKTSITDFVPATGKFLVMTEVDAPNYRLVEVDPADPAKENWRDIITAEEGIAAKAWAPDGGYLFAEYLKMPPAAYTLPGSMAVASTRSNCPISRRGRIRRASAMTPSA